MAKKAALGRGLSALLPQQQEPSSAPDTTPEADAPAGGDALPQSRLYNFEDRVRLLGRVAEIEVEHIRPNPYQPRKHFDEQALDELAASIQPITVRALGGHQYEVISGERRLRAARRAGLPRIPAYVREADTEEMLEIAIVENVQREDLNPIEEALGYQQLSDECGLTQEEVAKRVGKSRTAVTNALRLLKLPPRVLALVRDGQLSSGHARMLVTLDDDEALDDLLDHILGHQLTVRDVERLVKELKEGPKPTEPEPESDTPTGLPDTTTLQVRAFTDRLRTRFSTNVAIKHKPDGSGRIEIQYYSEDDLERLLELIGE